MSCSSSPKRAATCGFLVGPFPGRLDWLPQRLLQTSSRAGSLACRDSPVATIRRPASTTTLPPEIFKAYDIRGIVGKTLTPPIVRAIGQALGSLARERGRDTLVVGRDGRLSGPGARGGARRRHPRGRRERHRRRHGRHADDATSPRTTSARSRSVMVTGSHNPPDYNGLKMVVAGDTLSGADIQALRARIEAGALATGAGTYRTHDIAPAYLDRIVGDVRLARPLKIAVDCGNGVAGAFAPTLFRRLGCEVTEMYCDVDGTFPEPPSRIRRSRRTSRDLIALRRARTGTSSASRSTATATGSAS